MGWCLKKNKTEMRSITDAGCKARQDRGSSHLEPGTGGKVLAFRRDGTKGRTVNMLGLRGNAPLGGKQAARRMTNAEYTAGQDKGSTVCSLT